MPLSKCTLVDSPSPLHPKNFSKAAGVITLTKNIGCRLKDWGMISAAKECFPELRIAQVTLAELTKTCENCSGVAPVILQPFLYKAVNLTLPMDVGEIVNHICEAFRQLF